MKSIAARRRRLFCVSIVLVAAAPCIANADDSPFAAHNAYPWRLYPKDRFQRALASGLKHIEVDITYDPKRQAVVATHDAQASGAEPPLGQLIEPLWSNWAANADEGYTLIIDFKSAGEEIVRGLKQLLDSHRSLLSSLTKPSGEFKPGKITVCLTGNVAAHHIYDRMIADGTDYLAFSDDTGCPADWQPDPANYVPKSPANFVRFITLEKQNFMDGPRATGIEHLSLARLETVVKRANEGGYRLRIYTVNPRRKPDGTWDTRVWDVCRQAHVHMIATDAYDLAREYWNKMGGARQTAPQ
jgi:hypothetical protein